jgi:hypothetical protein
LGTRPAKAPEPTGGQQPSAEAASTDTAPAIASEVLKARNRKMLMVGAAGALLLVVCLVAVIGLTKRPSGGTEERSAAVAPSTVTPGASVASPDAAATNPDAPVYSPSASAASPGVAPAGGEARPAIGEGEQPTAESLPKIRTASQSPAGNMGTLLLTFDKSGRQLPTVLATNDRGEPIQTVCADMQKLVVYQMSQSPGSPAAAELKSIKCDIQLHVYGKTLVGSVEGTVATLGSDLPANVRADCRTVAAQALGAGNCLDLRGRFDGSYLVIFDDSGAVVQTHCLVCTNPSSRLQSNSYRIVPATVTVTGAATSQSLPSEVMYVQPRPA